ncbi:Translation initiation factor eIF-2B subunit epsilon [Echinococcus granulosus]|uniref:Translation initiation factor eIF2B subunit epsilon n=1 Tax=Echinococcus granulosus TaxID=6210 RepID=U6JL46_ECHGR|nr:Translation initiation factor eIF-2B subunit epsilon [Echinococcus granulosus]EUB59209.1 Translation initiation factor eIF-2B subunit epsilon [Echinococcus granulosus]KAH9284565.1 Translation initiation factor eIF-2B subunit epsilon [Echinococcus granulosus]CDS23185.1 translation initiation factor eIF 2B subunit [Echinococcus granulosus]
MPPKGKKAPLKTNVPAFKEEEVPLTAVIIAEDVAERFEPITKWVPHSLLPLANVPLLHISISCLIRDGFRNIIIYACRDAQKIQKFVDASCYTRRFPLLKIVVFNGNGSRCLGEAMRDIECNQLLRGVEEFVCLPADLVSDVSLIALLNDFKERRKKSSSLAIDLIYTTLPPFSSPEDVRCTVVHTSPDMKVIQVSRHNREMPAIFATEAVFAAAKAKNVISIRSDLLDTRVLICSSHIPPLFQDNFDYDSVDDLVNGMITNEEIMGYTVNIQFAPSSQIIVPVAPCFSYLLRVTPHFLTRLGSSRVHPPNYLVMEPFSRLLEGVEYAATTTSPLAIAPTCFVSRSADIDPKASLIGACLVGEYCCLERGVVLTDTVLGDNCTVGKNSHLSGVVALSDVHIGANVRLNQSWLCSGACIHDKVHLGPRCFVGVPREGAKRVDNGHSGRMCIEAEPEINLPPESIIVASEEGEERDWTVIKRVEVSRTEVSFMEEDGDEVVADSDAGSVGYKDVTLWRANWGQVSVSSQLDDSETSFSRLRSSGVVSADPESEAGVGGASANLDVCGARGGEPEDTDDEFLIQELQKTLSRSLELKQPSDVVMLEVNSLKHAYNISLEDLAFLFVKALLALTSSSTQGSDPAAFAIAFKRILAHFASVLEKYVSSSTECASYCLQAVEDQACYQPVVMEAARWLLPCLYDVDLVSEEVVREWVVSSPLLLDDELASGCRKLRESIKPFMDWLDEAEEEDDED